MLPSIPVFMLVEAKQGRPTTTTESLTCKECGVHGEHAHSVACSPVELDAPVLKEVKTQDICRWTTRP
eukprot:288524-Amphidinium_carterae.2